MPKAHISSSLQQGVVFSGTNVNPPIMTPYTGQFDPIYSLQWKAGLQGWTYFNESVIDVTGLTTNKDESLFFSGCDVQQPYPIQASDNAGGFYPLAIYEYFFITDRRMTREEFQESIGPGAPGNASGVSFAASPVDQQSLIFGFSRCYEPYQAAGAGLPGSATTLNLREMWQSNFGFARSTASNKLYCYHCAWSYTQFNFQVTIPDTRFIVSYVADKEKDLAYLQRLKRSYELQNEL
jgi:hypothetical protein